MVKKKARIATAAKKAGPILNKPTTVPTPSLPKTKEEEALTEVYPDNEQGILPEETSEEIEQDMKTGKKNEDIYEKEGRELLEEDDEIDTWEEGFMEGAHDGGQLGKDALTGEPLLNVEDVVELEYKGEIYRFVNDENAGKWLEMAKKGKKKKGKD
ncbi:hypothetical protein HYX14_02775 [Candidatus Woesearchaeota archaeon]|nr:hypothetical protein [Candidatus Woesearchaeota archaeon]